MLPLAPTQPARLIKTTTSRCPACLKPAAAEVWERHGPAGGVWMVKSCGEHGRSEVLLARDPRYYHESHGAGAGGAARLVLGAARNLSDAKPLLCPMRAGASRPPVGVRGDLS